jgi:hypothetical protein
MYSNTGTNEQRNAIRLRANLPHALYNIHQIDLITMATINTGTLTQIPIAQANLNDDTMVRKIAHQLDTIHPPATVDTTPPLLHDVTIIILVHTGLLVVAIDLHELADQSAFGNT